jgi:prepilin-type N-terminal cleavage/methylation domain-containing protein
MRRRGGFTLLETLVALAIAAVVLSALYGAVARASVARQRATRSAERVATARTLLLRLASELEAATTLGEPGSEERFVVAAPAPDAPAWSTLRFATRDGRRPAADEVRLVAYRVGPPGLLERREAFRFPPPDARERDGITMLEGVRRFRVRCFDGTVWRDQWTVPLPPRAVEITIGVDDGAGGTDELMTRVALTTRGGA